MEFVNAVSQITQVPKKEKVAIIGCADSKSEAPWHLTEEFEFWGVNNLFLTFQKPFTRWFDIHQFSQEGGKWFRRGKQDFRGMPVDKYLEALGKLPFPIYMQQAIPLVPNAIMFPFAVLAQAFGNYYTNTISWEISLAMAEGFKEIHIYGVDMAVDCLGADSRVLTSDLRWVPCGDLNIGDELLGFDEYPFDGRSRKWRKTIVTKISPVLKPCSVVQLEDGTSFLASDKHGWLTHGENVNRWKTTDELITRWHRKDRPTRIVKAVDPWESKNTWGSGYLSAAFDGEGCIAQSARHGTSFEGSYVFTCSFSQKDNAMLETVTNQLAEQGFGFSVKDGDCVKTVSILGGRSGIMRFLGQIRPQRLLNNFAVERLGVCQSKEDVAVVSVESAGEREVIGIETDSNTFVAEGFLSHNSEYFHQRPSCEYFLGMAVGKGIKVFIPDTCDLLKTRFLYGAQEPIELPFRNKISAMQKSMHERRAKSEQEMQLAQRKMFEYNGALAATAEIDKIYKNVTGG